MKEKKTHKTPPDPGGALPGATPDARPQEPIGATPDVRPQEPIGAAPALGYRNGKEVARGGVLGFFIGLAIIVPGVSGSAAAILFRLYDALLYAIGNLFKQFRRCAIFLLPIGAGAAVGFLLGFLAVRELLQICPFTVIALFAGLMLGAYPAVTYELRGERKTPGRCLLFAVGLLLPAALSALSLFAAPGPRPLAPFGWQHGLLFLLLGGAVALTQLVPGLSATALLMVAGYFAPLMQSVSLDYWREEPLVFAVYACLFVGFAVGLIGWSKALNALFAHVRATAFFGIAGLAVGSIVTMFFNPDVFAVYQSWAAGAPFAADLWTGVGLFLAGAALSYALVRVERRRAQTRARGGKK